MDKNKAADFEQLRQIFLQTDFLLLPTRAECAGVVFSEAAAYGIPSITTDTGGVTSYVQNGINGYTLPLGAGGDAYAKKLAELFLNKSRMLQLRQSSRRYYDEQLNWDIWGRKFKQIVMQLKGRY